MINERVVERGLLMKASSIFSAILAALGEDLDRGRWFTKIDVYLAILTIDLLFATHISLPTHV